MFGEISKFLARVRNPMNKAYTGELEIGGIRDSSITTQLRVMVDELNGHR